jgi:hypothetical protein
MTAVTLAVSRIADPTPCWGRREAIIPFAIGAMPMKSDPTANIAGPTTNKLHDGPLAPHEQYTVPLVVNRASVAPSDHRLCVAAPGAIADRARVCL